MIAMVNRFRIRRLSFLAAVWFSLMTDSSSAGLHIQLDERISKLGPESPRRAVSEEDGERRICFAFRAEAPGGLSLPLLKFWPVLFRLNRLSAQRWTFIPPKEIREQATPK